MMHRKMSKVVQLWNATSNTAEARAEAARLVRSLHIIDCMIVFIVCFPGPSSPSSPLAAQLLGFARFIYLVEPNIRRSLHRKSMVYDICKAKFTKAKCDATELDEFVWQWNNSMVKYDENGNLKSNFSAEEALLQTMNNDDGKPDVYKGSLWLTLQLVWWFAWYGWMELWCVVFRWFGWMDKPTSL